MPDAEIAAHLLVLKSTFEAGSALYTCATAYRFKHIIRAHLREDIQLKCLCEVGHLIVADIIIAFQPGKHTQGQSH